MLPKILRNDIRMRALAELTVEEFNSLRVVIKRLNIMNVYEVDASFLPWLAWWFRVDAWDDEWSEERQRESIANALILRKYKGTVWAVEHALELSLFDAVVVPWYAMVPEGTRGTFRIDAVPSDSRSLTQSDYATFITLTESNKQGSQHWKGNIKHDPSLGSAYAAPVIRTRKRWVSNSIVPLHVTDITIEPTSIIVYEGEPVNVSATVQMSDGTTTHDVRFESSDTSIVTVDDVGLVSFAGKGTASVYAISTFNDISSAECLVVSHEALAPVSVAISGLPASLAPGDAGRLTATVSYNDSTSSSSLDEPSVVSWLSSDESIITVDANGNYSAVASGSVTITATSTEDADISDSVALESIEDYERFSIVVGEGLYGPDTLTSVGVFLYSPDHPDYKDTFGDFSSKNWPSGEPIISITSKAQLMWRRRSSDVIAYFSARAKWPKWRDWDGVTVTLTHGSESISQSLTFGNYYIKISNEGIPVHDFLTARIGQTVDVELSEYVATAEEKAAARLHTMTLLNE
ncbi:phage tail protein I [Vibrio parahaemolyticus]|uniref:phage tail protein I n=2 Tax=Vibrio parahaemolyticus TaxID=670 RepID=UPI00177DB26B|nr:phage tail protein I [Vibrio parahaemolyticus]MBD6947966.1 phage tail protein I [Vibrio parahaemolyticus]MBD6959697.1 phage tail protein I [Vibrio parahaemolyticus]MBD6977585.1 phage tail protein I [Vibrio parahaemolyticus]MBD6983459.1 phage tail protein I [Vibrio parahaemolyticus]MBD6986788.1 phage tail protein I [Vibrio parahaemolyticus]